MGKKVGVGGAQLPSLFLGAFWTGKLGLFAVTLALEQASIESLLSISCVSSAPLSTKANKALG